MLPSQCSEQEQFWKPLVNTTQQAVAVMATASRGSHGVDSWVTQAESLNQQTLCTEISFKSGNCLLGPEELHVLVGQWNTFSIFAFFHYKKYNYGTENLGNNEKTSSLILPPFCLRR